MYTITLANGTKLTGLDMLRLTSMWTTSCVLLRHGI